MKLSKGMYYIGGIWLLTCNDGMHLCMWFDDRFHECARRELGSEKLLHCLLIDHRVKNDL